MRNSNSLTKSTHLNVHTVTGITPYIATATVGKRKEPSQYNNGSLTTKVSSCPNAEPDFGVPYCTTSWRYTTSSKRDSKDAISKCLRTATTRYSVANKFSTSWPNGRRYSDIEATLTANGNS